jgi:transposase
MAKRGSSGGRTAPPSARRYSPEFKRDAVALLRSSAKSIAAVAKELGISDVTLAAWARDQEMGRQNADTQQAEADRKEAAALRREIKELKEEIEILKRFTAYWVKEGGQ